jgi:hypothetical protein
MGVRGGIFGWGTALVARRSRVRLPMGLSGFFIYFRPHYDTGADSASSRYEYQESFLGGKGGRCVRLTMLAPSFADCLRILRAPAYNGIALALTLVDFVEENKSSWLLFFARMCGSTAPKCAHLGTVWVPSIRVKNPSIGPKVTNPKSWILDPKRRNGITTTRCVIA